MQICMMVHIGPGQVFSPFEGSTPRNPQNFCPQKSEHLENDKLQCYMSITSAWRRGSFLKCIAWDDGTVAPEVSPYKDKYVFFARDRYLAPICVKIYLMVHIGHGQVFSPFESSTPGIPKWKIFAL